MFVFLFHRLETQREFSFVLPSPHAAVANGTADEAATTGSRIPTANADANADANGRRHARAPTRRSADAAHATTYATTYATYASYARTACNAARSYHASSRHANGRPSSTNISRPAAHAPEFPGTAATTASVQLSFHVVNKNKIQLFPRYFYCYWLIFILILSLLTPHHSITITRLIPIL